MKAVLAFFVFLIILVSASAVIDVQIDGKVPSSMTNVHPYQQKNIFTISAQGKPQGFTSPLSVADQTKAAVTFRRTDKAPPIAQWYMFNQQLPGSIPEPSSTPTGSVVVYQKPEGSGLMVAAIIIISIISLFLILKGQTAVQTKIVFVALTLAIMAFASMKVTEPTGYTIQEYEQPIIQQQTITPSQVLNAFTITWPNGGPVTFLPAGGPPPPTTQCNDGMNNDFEDNLIDCLDPGCHSDGNPANPLSCVPTDDLEMNMLEYDHQPVVDNEIDVYDIVNWVQYFNGNTTVLVHCTSATCTNQIGNANCVGNVDPNKDTLVNAADMTYLQNAELNNADSRTIPAPGLNNSICNNPS